MDWVRGEFERGLVAMPTFARKDHIIQQLGITRAQAIGYCSGHTPLVGGGINRRTSKHIQSNNQTKRNITEQK